MQEVYVEKVVYFLLFKDMDVYSFFLGFKIDFREKFFVYKDGEILLLQGEWNY